MVEHSVGAGSRPAARRLRNAVSGFFAANVGLSNRVERRLPQARSRVSALYAETVGRYLEAFGGSDRLVVDVGGGKRCHFAGSREPGTRLVGVDVSGEELAQNRDVDERLVADVTDALPFGSGEVDLIASRFVLEHLEDLGGFVRESARVLKPGGHAVHVFPSKFAPYALLNRALPDELARGLLHFIKPQTKGGCGFPAYYDRCYYSAAERLFRENGFEVVEARFNYYQSQYFKFFFPLYLASAAYEALLRAVGARDLCPYTVIVARKP